MFAFHFTWDLGYFGFIAPEIPFTPGFMMFGHVIAAAFLLVAGGSLALASQRGMNWQAYWLRMARLTAAALLVTAVTFYLFPESFIFFGILHCLAAAILTASLFLRAPLWASAAAALAILFIPAVWESAFFDKPLLAWVGLGIREPLSNDWRAFFPWAGFTLAGLTLMRAALAAGLPARWAAWRADNALVRPLVWGGRHSLAIYLIHQPLFFALVYTASLAGASPEEANYQASCESQCVTAGGAAPFCTRACNCFSGQLKKEGLWRSVMRNSLNVQENEKFVALSRQCARDAVE